MNDQISAPDGVAYLVISLKLLGLPKEALNVGFLTDFEAEQFEKFWLLTVSQLRGPSRT